ncbi:MAG: response regulator transcription factor [Clostridia bacterium]|nr:response regulator transcription factor [Clostridia bacterium]
MDNLRVLIVEDDERIRDLLRMYLENESFAVDEVTGGLEALAQQDKQVYDLIILDIMIPGLDGWKVCRKIRETSDVPIIMVTARGEEPERILGLELGADDYLVKPFSPKELLARIKAVFRRLEGVKRTREQGLQLGFLKVQHQARQVFVREQPLNLTPKEYDLLYFLITNEGRVISREELLEKVWGYQYYDVRTIDTHVKQLREKISKAHQVPDYIKTVWGVGYKFEVSL